MTYVCIIFQVNFFIYCSSHFFIYTFRCFHPTKTMIVGLLNMIINWCNHANQNLNVYMLSFYTRFQKPAKITPKFWTVDLLWRILLRSENHPQQSPICTPPPPPHWGLAPGFPPSPKILAAPLTLYTHLNLSPQPYVRIPNKQSKKQRNNKFW